MKIPQINEGIGGAYERIAYSNIIKRIAKEENCKNILELGATFIAGLPGFNSCLLSQAGFDTTIAVHHRDLKGTKKIWNNFTPGGKVEIVELDNNLKTPFTDKQFDLVWNHLAFEHYKNPLPLVKEMSRISRKVIINFTLSPWNIGFPLHYLGHKIQNKQWDHGYFKNTLISTMEKFHRKAGLDLLESGGCDAPPWMDTVDAQMGNSMTYFDFSPKAVKDRWIWNSASPRCQRHPLIKIFWNFEKNMPEWFRRSVAHHLYTASRKNF